jgi:RNA polymerase sigma-70 factor (ECF subfamily)
LKEDWEDLRQEIQTRVLRNLKRGSFQGRSTLHTYVHRISKNVAIDHSRQAFRRREIKLDPLEEKLPEKLDFSRDSRQAVAKDLLARILSRLSAEDRTLVRLVFELHYSYDEVSRELAIPEGTVKSRMSRCKDRLLKLRRELAGEE